jgi:hypothetical protein
MAAIMKADPHRARAKILLCWSHESKRRHPARPGVNTAMASNVGRFNTTIMGGVGQRQCHRHVHVAVLPACYIALSDLKRMRSDATREEWLHREPAGSMIAV